MHSNALAFGGLALIALAARAPAQGATRLDLASAYVRFEEALLERAPSGAELAAASTALDLATTSFFVGDAARAIEALERARLALLPAEADLAGALALASLRLEPDPPHGRVGANVGPLVRWTRIFEPDEDWASSPPFGKAPLSSHLVLVDGGGEVLRTVDLRLQYPQRSPATGQVQIGAGLDLSAPGALMLELRDLSGRVHQRAPWPLLRHDSAQRAAELRAELAKLRSAAPASLERALVTFADRIELLDPAGSAGPGARLASDLARLEADLVRELAELRAGSDPYRGRPGALWRVARLLGVEVPLWTIAPPRAPGAPAPPLVIALHGAGGEESQWIEAYGRGALVALARERGCLLVLPRTYALTGRPDLFAELLLDVAQDQLFDPTRVLVIGHSMGAAAAADLANRRPDLLRGVALLAGGANLLPSPTLPRTLVALGTLDRIVPPAPARRAALAAGAELLEFEHHGHTTFVPLALPAAFDLLER